MQQRPVAWGDAQLFFAIVRSGSLRGASRELSLDASTVSRRLVALEQGLGVRLVDRSQNRLTLTSAGQELANSGERVHQELLELSRRIALADQQASGVVQLTIPGSLSALVARALASLHAQHPQLEVELLTNDALLAVDGARVDVALRIANDAPEHLVGQRVGRLAVAIYGSHAYLREHPGAPTRGEPHWVEWDRRLAQKPAFRWLDETYGERRVAARGLSTGDVQQLVREGVGVGALPCIVGDADPALRRLADMPDEFASSVWLLTHPELRTLPRIRLLMSCLRKALAEAKPQLAGLQPAAKGRTSRRA